ncbi:MAG: hypothetical protein DI529_04965 [Chryseobacterium sp.]|nr:MAG: hypothetical protein DI529_04965 [Chryseobacterium sp.]
MVGNAFLQFKADAIPFLKEILAFFPVVLKRDCAVIRMMIYCFVNHQSFASILYNEFSNDSLQNLRLLLNTKI